MNVYLLELRNLRKSAALGALFISAILLLMLAFFPSMQTDAMKALANAELQGIDPAILAVLGMSEMMDFSQITNFFGYIIQFIMLIIIIITTQHAMSILIKEETDGTIEFLGAKPISRAAIFTQKLLAHFTVFVFTMLVYIVTTTVGYLLFSDYSFAAALEEASIFFGAIFFVGTIFSSLGLLLSAFLRSSKGAAGITIAIVFGTFLLGILSVLVKDLDFLIWVSPLDWIKAAKLMSKGILWQEWIIGITCSIACICAAWLRYRKKDLLI